MAKRCNYCSMQSSPGLSCSFEHLIREAVKRGIVQSYSESPMAIRLEMNRSVVVLDPFHARMLLCNRLRREGLATTTQPLLTGAERDADVARRA